ncbi:MAG: hypothetical protein CL434_11650 [Acidimicrobiaceae bacterium]|nr:hypothetical protein [Acidimicrobiaceae bacterium]
MLQHHRYEHDIILGNLASPLLTYCTRMARAGFCSAHTQNVYLGLSSMIARPDRGWQACIGEEGT